MSIKSCPFCGNSLSINYKEMYAFCSECLVNGIDIKVHGSDVNNIIKKWNTREFDNKFLNNFDYIDEYRKYLRGELIFNSQTTPQEIKNIRCLEPQGSIIFSNGDIENIEIDHEFTLKRLLGLDRNCDISLDVDKMFEKMGIIKITYQYKFMNINLIDKPTSEQINSLLLFCVRNSSWCERFELVLNSRLKYINKIENLESELKELIGR